MIFTAGLINILMIWLRNLREYGLVGIWALLAIAVSNGNNNGNIYIIYSCYVVIAILFVAIIINALKNRNRSLENM
ncbi:hypothetical protein D3C87_2069820 [compost metagenome]